VRVRYAVVDVDDVLIATAEALDAAIDAMLVPLADHFGQRQAAAVQREFTRSMGIGVRRLRAGDASPDDEYADLMRRTARWQRGLTESGVEVKAWSRHALVACALEACDLPVTAAVVEAAADRYWTTVTARAAVYPDAVGLIRRLRDAGVAIHLATGSDGFLTFDDVRQTFTYAPEESVRLKLARLRGLAALGFGPDDITVADPIGKPNPEFFRVALRRFSAATGQDVDLAATVVVGDSLANDILPLLDLGAAHGVWLLRDGTSASGGSRRHPQVTVVSSLDAEEVRDVFSA
jgi:FMN phosphatase YigB (HAD superfamily)